jgi:hypothetical protein
VRLTGVLLLLTALTLTAVAVALTVLLWSRFGRWRLLSRVVGVLLAETLTVLTIGLAANRHEQFYPSWQALYGDTGTVVETASRPPGLLDEQVHGTGAMALPWTVGGVAATVEVPAGYLSRPLRTYPAVVALGSTMAAVPAVGVVLTPTAGALAALPAELGQNVRVTARGWAMVADARYAALAEREIRADPGVFGALVIVGGAAPPGLPPGTALAVAGRPAVPAPGVAALPDSWAAAVRWAVAQTSLPLAAAEQLPPAATRPHPTPSPS